MEDYSKKMYNIIEILAFNERKNNANFIKLTNRLLMRRNKNENC